MSYPSDDAAADSVTRAVEGDLRWNSEYATLAGFADVKTHPSEEEAQRARSVVADGETYSGGRGVLDGAFAVAWPSADQSGSGQLAAFVEQFIDLTT